MKSLDLILVSLKVDDDEILIHLMVLLSKMSNNPNKNLMRNLLEKLKDEHILQIMVFFEKNSNEISKMSILLLFCNIFAEDDDWVQVSNY